MLYLKVLSVGVLSLLSVLVCALVRLNGNQIFLSGCELSGQPFSNIGDLLMYLLFDRVNLPLNSPHVGMVVTEAGAQQATLLDRSILIKRQLLLEHRVVQIHQTY